MQERITGLSDVGRIVSKDELADHLWDGRATSDTAISTQIRTVRRAPGDDRNTQLVIRTHPKRGFEFVADVEVLPEKACPEEYTGRAPRQKHIRLYVVGAALVFLSPIVGIINVSQLRDTPVETPADLSPRLSLVVLPFDNLSGDPIRDQLANALSTPGSSMDSRIRTSGPTVSIQNLPICFPCRTA